jgi:hypothetical protein
MAEEGSRDEGGKGRGEGIESCQGVGGQSLETINDE